MFDKKFIVLFYIGLLFFASLFVFGKGMRWEGENLSVGLEKHGTYIINEVGYFGLTSNFYSNYLFIVLLMLIKKFKNIFLLGLFLFSCFFVFGSVAINLSDYFLVNVILDGSEVYDDIADEIPIPEEEISYDLFNELNIQAQCDVPAVIENVLFQDNSVLNKS